MAGPAAALGLPRARSPWRARRPTCWRSSTSSRRARRCARARARVAGHRRAGRGRAGRGRRGGRRGGRRRRSCAAATSRRARARAGAAPPRCSCSGARLAIAARGALRGGGRRARRLRGVLALMLALAALLERLRDDPATIGKRYQLTVRLDPILEPDVAAIPGVADVAPALPGRGRGLVPPRRAAAAGGLPRRPHGVRGAAAGRGAARPRAGRGRGRARAGRRARAAAGRDARRAARGRRRGAVPRRRRRAGAGARRADRVRPAGPAARTPSRRGRESWR